MTQHITTPGADAPAISTPAEAGATRTLLACGAVAGPLFVVVAAVQAFTRTGFDLVDHPVSLLSVGEWGWIQIANFVVTGALFVAFAVGMRRVLHPGRAGTWGPRLIGAFGVSLIAGGVFVADPGLGFPPGTPPGVPDDFTWHGIAHGFAPVIGFLALTLACFVVARRSPYPNRRAWAVLCVVTGVALQVLGAIPNVGGNFLPLQAAIVVGFGWASAYAARLLVLTRDA